MKILIAFLVVALQKNNKPVGHEYCRATVNQWFYALGESVLFGGSPLASFALFVLAPVVAFAVVSPVFGGGWALLLGLLLGFLTLMTSLTLHKLRRRMFRYRRAWMEHDELEMKELAFNDWQVDASLSAYRRHNEVIDRMLVSAFEQSFVYLFWYWFIGIEGLLFYFLFQIWFSSLDQFDDQPASAFAQRWVRLWGKGVGLINNLAARVLAVSFLFSGNAWGGLKGRLTDCLLDVKAPTEGLVIKSARSTMSLNYLQETGADNTLLGKQQIIMTRKLISRTLGVWFIGFALLSILVP